MPGSTDFQPFATAANANVVSQATWNSLGLVATGFTSGIAISAQLNKAWRQGVFGSATLFNWVVSQINVNQADDGNLTNAVTNLSNALKSFINVTSGVFLVFNGNPNGNVAGVAGNATTGQLPTLCENTANGLLYVCTVTGNATGATWVLGSAAGVTSVTAGTGINVGAGPGGTITTTGTLNLKIAGNVSAGNSTIGGVQVDGTTILINGNGTISSVNAGGSLNPVGNIVNNDFAVWKSSNTLGDQPAATVTQIRTGTDNLAPITSLGLAGAQAWGNLTDAATIAWNVTNPINARVTLGGNRVLGNLTGMIDGGVYTLKVIQPASGGPVTLTFPANFDFGTAGTPTLSTTAGAVDSVYLQWDNALATFDAGFKQG